MTKKKNGGTCSDNGGKFACQCEFPFSGATCEIDNCADIVPCENGGTCKEGPLVPPIYDYESMNYIYEITAYCGY